MRRKIELWGTGRRINPRLSECNLSGRKEIDLNPSLFSGGRGRKEVGGRVYERATCRGEQKAGFDLIYLRVDDRMVDIIFCGDCVDEIESVSKQNKFICVEKARVEKAPEQVSFSKFRSPGRNTLRPLPPQGLPLYHRINPLDRQAQRERQYHIIDQSSQIMATVMQKIKDIEDEMARTQKNKATAHHLGLLKAKLAKLRRELLAPSTKGGGGAGEGFDVTKSGDARVGLVGFPSVGKSTLLNKLTGTFSEVASYEFTTLTCIPGVIMYRGAKIQLLDLPGIIEGAKDGKGRGRQVISTARTCNCILIVLDAIKPITHKRIIEKELEGFGIRLNKEPPNLTFRRKDKGGINLTSTFANTSLDLETVKAICGEYRIHNADISLRYDATADDLIDVIEGSRIYTPCIYVVNKIDQITVEELEILDNLPHYCPISAHLEWNLDGLLEKIWEYLSLTRIYTKPKGMNPDYEDPVILSSKKRTVEDFCNKIHKDMLKQFKYALVWGSSAKHKPQRVGREHELEDEDVVQIIKKV
ncbi:Developmentally regulated G-protein 1 [Platanthera zijinensis]|uniref:Developmentally regulated G-protein 1 n=1 Tax=Platanthera zijinensis TaxID=2320716 RepID=A0AAP0BXW3_9ASPA